MAGKKLGLQTISLSKDSIGKSQPICSWIIIYAEHFYYSLSATILRRRITGVLQHLKSSAGAAALQIINQNTVYSYPSINALSQYLMNLISSDAAGASQKSRADLIEEMIAKYAFTQKEGVNGQQSSLKTSELVILLTGSTGNLGSQVFEQLLSYPQISKVYALNRPSSGPVSMSERHLDRFRVKGLDIALLSSSKVVYLESDVSQERLGLSEAKYNEVSFRGLLFQNVVIDSVYDRSSNRLMLSSTQPGD